VDLSSFILCIFGAIYNQYITPTTCKEDMNAIEKLNTGKSADENGIQAEHFRNTKEELAQLPCEIINQIFQDFDIPDSMKNGILTPILKEKN
jgi:hypothetical protein